MPRSKSPFWLALNRGLSKRRQRNRAHHRTGQAIPAVAGELLEKRVLLTTKFFLDFGAGLGMGNSFSTTVGNFTNIFGPGLNGDGTGSDLNGLSGLTNTSSLVFRPLSYDFDLNGILNNNDITALADAVVPIVQRALEPFDIEVVVGAATSLADAVAAVGQNAGSPTGENDAYNFVMDVQSNAFSSDAGDGIASVGASLANWIAGLAADDPMLQLIDFEPTDTSTGDGSVGNNAGLFGIAAGDDLFAQDGNLQDEATLSFTDTIFDSTSGTEGTAEFNENLAHRIAYTATHEGFHTFTYVHTTGTTAPTTLLTSGDVIRLGSLTREDPFMVTRFDLHHTGIAVSEPNNYLLAANDPDIGLRDENGNNIPDFAFVTGTGAHDIITLTANGGTSVVVSIQAFTSAAFTTLIASDAYTINLATDTEGTIVIDGGINSDRIRIDGTINADFLIRGGTGQDGGPAIDNLELINTSFLNDPSGFGSGTITTVTGSQIEYSELEKINGDDHGGNFIEATSIPVASSVAGELEFNGDYDYFSFHAIADHMFELEVVLGTLSDSVLELYDRDGTTLLDVNDDGGAGLGSLITFTAPATGTYFLKARAFNNNKTGTYTLETSVDDHGNSAASSTFVNIPSSRAGTLEEPGDQDYFSFDVLAGSTYEFEVALGSLSDSILELYNTDGTSLLTSNDDGGVGLGSLIEYTFPTAGTYFVKVRAFGNNKTGTYDLLTRRLAEVDGNMLLAYGTQSANTITVNETATDFEVIIDGNALDPIPKAGITQLKVFPFADDDVVVVNTLTAANTVLIEGGPGNDTLTVTGPSTAEIHGREGDDIINGGDGNDELFGEAGADTINGGEGNDTIRGGDGADILSGDGGNDDIRAGAGPDALTGGEGNDVLFGGVSFDTLSGNAGNDFLHGNGGVDQLFGGIGSDTLNGGSQDDTLNGGDGIDTLIGGGGNDVLNGGNQNDNLRGGSGDDILSAGDGNDSLRGEFGNDILLGGAGVDDLHGGTGRDILVGGGGQDTLLGISGDDILIGGTTTHDWTSLMMILDEWTRDIAAATRVSNIRNGTGLTGGNALTSGSTVLDDGVVDTINGAGGDDWAFRSLLDDSVSNVEFFDNL